MRPDLAFLVIWALAGLSLAALGSCRRSWLPQYSPCRTWVSLLTRHAYCGRSFLQECVFHLFISHVKS